MYDTLLFDFDGTLADTNHIKTEIFFYIANCLFGKASAQEFVDYHKKNGGVTRQKKISWLLRSNIDNQEMSDSKLQAIYANLLRQFADLFAEKSIDCALVERLDELRESTSNISWGVLTGGNADEVKNILKQFDSLSFFDLGVWGNPNTKDENLEILKSQGLLGERVLYIGDSKLDYEFSRRNGLDFALVTAMSEDPSLEDLMLCNEIRLKGADIHSILTGIYE